MSRPRRGEPSLARLRHAKFRQRATIESVDYHATRGLVGSVFQMLIVGDWIEASQNLIIEGPPDLAS